MSGTKPDGGRAKPLKAAFSQSAPPIREPRRKTVPVTLRLTESERETLEELAAGMTLSAYIGACLSAEQERRRQRRPGSEPHLRARRRRGCEMHRY
jgi:hypothetical protein